MTEIATIDWFGRWGTSIFSENTAIFMFEGMHNIFKVTAGYNSTYHHRMGWVVRGHLFSLKTLLY